MRYEAEIEELYAEIDKDEEDDEKLAQDAFTAIANAAMTQKRSEDIKIRQGREIRELTEQLRVQMEEMTVKETDLKVIIDRNNEILSKQDTTQVKIVDKFVRIERIVPQVIEKVVKIEKIVEKESLETRNKLMEEERALLKKEIRIQFSEKI